MTREEIKNKRLEIDKLFGTTDYTEVRSKRNDIGLIELYECKTDKRQSFIYKYPILILKDNKYYLSEVFILMNKWEELSKYPNRFETYVDNLFTEYNIVELLTDADDTMELFGKEFIPNINKLKEKYNTTEILFDGYCGLRIEKLEDTIPWESEIP